MKPFAPLAASALCALLTGCGDTFRYTLAGAPGLAPGDTLRLCSTFEEGRLIAAAVIGPDSTFRIEGRLAQPLVAEMRHGDRRLGPDPVLLEAGDIRLVASGDLRPWRIVGTPLNDALDAMSARQIALMPELLALEQLPASPERDRMADSLGSLYRQIPGQTMEAHRDDLLGAFLYARRASGDPSTLRRELDRFPEALRRNPALESVRRYAEQLERSSVGSRYTDLVLPDPAGEPAALSSLVGPGRWVLLDFWSTWCHPCMEELPALRAAYAAYHPRGLEIYAVALRPDAEQWRALARRDDTAWVHVVNSPEGEAADAAECYGIRAIPSNFLISPDGVIVARNLHGEALMQKLAEAMP